MDGILIFFDDQQTDVFVWSDSKKSGLNVLKKSQLPEIWDLLEIGSSLRFNSQQSSAICYVTDVFEVNGEKTA
jgi:hypothetical protein